MADAIMRLELSEEGRVIINEIERLKAENAILVGALERIRSEAGYGHSDAWYEAEATLALDEIKKADRSQPQCSEPKATDIASTQKNFSPDGREWQPCPLASTIASPGGES